MKAKKTTKQMPLFETFEVRPRDLDTEADRQERYRLSLAEKKADEERHARWLKHNTSQRMNLRECPCKQCVKTRRSRSK